MSELPLGWIEIPLGEELDCRKGKKPNELFSEKEGELVPYVDIKAFEKNQVRQYAKPSDGVLAEKHDSLMVWDGARSGLVGNGIAGVIGSTLMRITPKSSHRKYLHHFLRSKYNEINYNPRGAGIPHVNPDLLFGFDYPLAPINEQKRIADKLDTLLACVDATRERLDRIPQILKQFRQSVLAAATSGRLTEEWREKFSCSEKWVGDIDWDVLDDRCEPFVLPDSWEWDHMGRLIEMHNNLRIPIKQSDRDKRSGPYPYYGAFGVIDDFDDYMFDGRYLLIAEDGKNLESRSRPIALIADGKFWVNNHAHVIQGKKHISIDYLALFFNSSVVEIDQFLTGVDQVKLNKEALLKIPVPVPCFLEQKEIVRRAEALFALVDKLEARYQQARAQVEKLTPALLAKAFRGELVEQDPNDEPAERLLERVRAAREEGSGMKKRLIKMRNES